MSLGLRLYHMSCSLLFSLTGPLKQPKAEIPQAWHDPFSTILIGYFLYQFISVRYLQSHILMAVSEPSQESKSHWQVQRSNTFSCIKIQAVHMSTDCPKSSFRIQVSFPTWNAATVSSELFPSSNYNLIRGSGMAGVTFPGFSIAEHSLLDVLWQKV